MFCQNCGKQILENAKFCNHCGAEQAGNTAQKTSRNNTQPQQRTQQGQPDQQIDEKAFKKYVTPYIARRAKDNGANSNAVYRILSEIGG